MSEQLGTVVSTLEGPSPSVVSFVVNNGKAHKGMFAELEYSEGTMMLLVEDVIKTNRYFERPDSVKVIGAELEKNFPASEWEFLIAKARPLGVFRDTLVTRPTFPPSPGVKVFDADNERIKKFLGLQVDGLDLGKLQFHDVEMKVNLSKLLQKHLAIVATSGAGKCLAPDQKIQLADGSYIEIGKLVDSKLVNERISVDGIEYAVNESDLSVMALNSENKVVPSKINVFARRKAPQEMLLLKTWSGREIKVTPEHVVPIFNEKISWEPASEIKENSFLLLPRLSIAGKEQAISLLDLCDPSKVIVEKDLFSSKRKQSKKKIPLSVLVTEEFARWMAYLLAEGHNFGGGFSFSNQNALIQEDFRKCLSQILLEEPKKVKKGGEVRYYNKILMPILEKIGFTNSSWTKFVPKEILQSDELVIAAFLSSFVDCDGHVSDKALEITLASKELIESINFMFLRLGVIPILRKKVVRGKTYSKLVVSGAKSMKILNEKLHLLIGYKQSSLEALASKEFNPNIDVIPNIHSQVFDIVKTLGVTQSMSGGAYSYYSETTCPSADSLKKLVGEFNQRLSEVEVEIGKAKELFFSLPNFSEEYACEIISSTYGKFDFNQIANGTGVSSTTARRVVRGITKPTKTAFILANSCLALQGEEDFGIKSVANLSVQSVAGQLIAICEKLGLEQTELCAACGLNSRALYSWATQESDLVYSNLYAVAKAVYIKAVKKEEEIEGINPKIKSLDLISISGLFFDKIVSIEKISSSCEYVYDLSVEHSNFIANNLIVHNSYFVSVLLEELLSRKKEQGQIGVVVFDTHGEYTSFGEPVKQSSENKFMDFSSKTKIVDGSKIRIACSKISIHLVSSIVELSPTQKRALARVFSKLNDEMKSGAGPYDLSAVKSELEGIDNEKTRAGLYGVVSELEDLGLFSKIDEPSIIDFVKPGQMVVIDLNAVISEKKKQVLVAYLANKLFNERRGHSKKIPPFALFVEEAHNFIPEGVAAEHAVARSNLRTIAREGRKFGASLVVISQRPKRLDTTTLANCNTSIILRITNPYDLDHISQSCEGLDKSSIGIISTLRVGEALVVGEAVSAPTFFKVRARKSAPSRHESTLEDSARAFQVESEKKSAETNTFL